MPHSSTAQASGHAAPDSSAVLALIEARRAGTDDGLPLDLRGARLLRVNLSGLDLMGSDFTGADLSQSDLSDANLFGATLVDAVLFETNLSGAELSGANLTGATLTEANLQRAGLGLATLENAILNRANFSHATLIEADLTGVSAQATTFDHVRACEAKFNGADLTGASLQHAELGKSDVTDAILDGADLRHSSFSHLLNYSSASWISVDIREVDFTGAYLCRRFILDENYIAEFRAQSNSSEALYRVWSITSDCGRSLARWGAWTAAIVLLFTWIYTFVELDYGNYETSLSPLYYSVVTLTTLGYGDVLPASPTAQIVAMIQVVIGYVMLGGLLSIFSNKMASRAD